MPVNEFGGRRRGLGPRQLFLVSGERNGACPELVGREDPCRSLPSASAITKGYTRPSLSLSPLPLTNARLKSPQIAMSEIQVAHPDAFEEDDPKIGPEKKQKNRRPASTQDSRPTFYAARQSHLTLQFLCRYCFQATEVKSMAVSSPTIWILR